MFLKYLLCDTFILVLHLSPFFAIECEIDPFLSNVPYLINPGESTVIYPKHGKRTISFQNRETVEFACPGAVILLRGSQLTRSSIEEATCQNGLFKISGQTRVSWDDLSCSFRSAARVRFLGAGCTFNSEYVDIGYLLSNVDGRFLKVITLCLDNTKKITLYASYEIPASIASQDTKTPRPSTYVQDDGFYGYIYDLKELYLKIEQRKTINQLLGLKDDDTKYIKDKGNRYLAKGHLAARRDFVYGDFQIASFRYINVAPQWQGFNNGNWRKAEEDVKNYAHVNNLDLQIWTGVYHVATLPHSYTGRHILLSLYDNGGISEIPVPAIFWKIVYSPVNSKAIVLIGLNNPYETNIRKYTICSDVSGQISWLTWNQHNPDLGISYACTYDSFRKVVYYAPNLVVWSLLR